MRMNSAHLDVLVVGAVLCELSLCAALHGEDGLCVNNIRRNWDKGCENIT
jgi:hypothetical protein